VADILFQAAIAITLLALVITFIRMLIGPDPVSRTVALDGMTIISLSVIVWLAFWSGRGIYIDVALVYGLISFTGVVALARYLERGL
jgi:multicomponent Na+:H+ antiporter subunit F